MFPSYPLHIHKNYIFYASSDFSSIIKSCPWISQVSLNSPLRPQKERTLFAKIIKDAG